MKSAIATKATASLRGRRYNSGLRMTVMGRALMGAPRAQRVGGAPCDFAQDRQPGAERL